MLKLKPETEFKDTDFGKIPKDWEVAILGDESKFLVIMGQSPPSKYYNQEGKGTPFAQGKKEFGDFYIAPTIFTTKCSKIAPSDSVLITVRAPVGELNLTKSELCIGRGIAAILNQSGNPLHNRFIYYALKALSEYLSMLGERGTTYDSVRKEELDSVSFPYPQPSEQERIASVLSWFDDLIENKKRQNEVLEKTAMAIFKSWFMDFEPFKDEEFVDSPLGKIPKGWDIRELGNVVKILYGEGLPERKRQEGPYPVIGSSGIIGYHSKYLVYAPSIVVGRKGNVGSIFLMLEPSFPIDTVFYTSPDTPSELVFYVYHFLKNTSLEEIASSHTAVPGLDIHILNSLKLPFPPEPIIQKFQSLVEPLFQKILLNQKEIMILRRVRDTLLPLLVFGKLRVEEL
jgi:type I restriction enzyme S subunit